MAAVIPYDGKDPLKYLYRTIHQLHKMGLDIIIVDTKFNLYPPYVKRIKQHTPGPGGARYDGFKYALKEGYDCIINADSHLIFKGNLHNLCKTKTWSSTYHHPWIETPIPMTLPVKIYASYVLHESGKIMWCSVIDHKPQLPLPMTSEPLYTLKRDILEQIVEWWRLSTSYGLDNIALLFAPPGELITTTYFYHLGVLDRGKPLKRKPTDKDAELFISRIWPQVEQKVLKFHETIPPQSRICFPMWP
jgi:hypothetical protein